MPSFFFLSIFRYLHSRTLNVKRFFTHSYFVNFMEIYTAVNQDMTRFKGTWFNRKVGFPLDWRKKPSTSASICDGRSSTPRCSLSSTLSYNTLQEDYFMKRSHERSHNIPPKNKYEAEEMLYEIEEELLQIEQTKQALKQQQAHYNAVLSAQASQPCNNQQ